MASVEVENIPSSAAVVSDFKFISKAKQLPIVNDATSYVLPLVNEAVAFSTKLHEQARGNCLYHQIEDVVFENIKKVAPIVPVGKGVKSQMRYAIDEIDNFACYGFDHLTTSIPALTHPTDELVTATTDATFSVASRVSDYFAGFGIVQTGSAGLKAVDSSLSITEKVNLVLGIFGFYLIPAKSEDYPTPECVKPDNAEALMPQEKEELRQPALPGITDMLAEDVGSRIQTSGVEASDVDDVLVCIIEGDGDDQLDISAMDSGHAHEESCELPCQASSHVHADLIESDTLQSLVL